MAALAMLGSLLCAPVQGAEGDFVAVSVKHILDSRGRRSNGRYTTDAQIKTAIKQANSTLSRNKASWRLWVSEVVEINGADRFFEINADPEFMALENEAKANPRKYAYRPNQINMYVLHSLFNGEVGGICSFPVDFDNMPKDIIVINNQGIHLDGVGWLHEMGHYFSLTHTFQMRDLNARNPDRQCTGLGAMHQRPGGAQIQVECPDNCPDSTNVMSYNNFPANQAVFSKCQLREMEWELENTRARVVRKPKSTPPPVEGESEFLRGDVNSDGSVNLTDAIVGLSYLMGGGAAPGCLDATDADDNGAVNLSDMLMILMFLSGSTTELPEPTFQCGKDPSRDSLGCAVQGCQGG